MDKFIIIIGETHPSSFAKVFSITVNTADYPEGFTPTQILEELFGHSDFIIDDYEEI